MTESRQHAESELTDPLGEVVAVDLGGTKTAAALMAPDGTLGPVHSVPTPARSGPEALLDAVAALIGEVSAAPKAIGIGTAGVVDVAAGVITSATDTIRGWPGTDVGKGIRQRTDCPVVHVQNDVDAHAAGECWIGAGAGAASVLTVAVGTGVGGSLVFDGVPRRGAHNVGGEIAHLPTPGAEQMMCPCGRAGHLEAIGAGPAIHRLYTERGGTAPDTRTVFRHAEVGDQRAIEAIELSAAAVGRAIAAVVTVVDPEVVVLAGGLPEAGARWWQPMEAAFRAEVIDVLADVELRPAVLGWRAALVGAGRFARLALAEHTGS